ncbi:hypothetical protein ACFVXG_26935 [Kitasatospora sp. NPDC058162]|uniref:hypothetical protein n=1 Tax=Kitasatospora sp. NPDC058162 TaxID=3346362 RepID=UPI0036DA855C
MRRSSRLAGAALLLTVGLATACTGGGGTGPQGGDGPWALNGLAATSASVPVQRTIDLLPAEGTAKILGVAEISGTDVILSVRGGVCQVTLLPDSLTEPTTTAPASVGAPRPAGHVGASDAHQDFPGTVLDGKYTVGSAQLQPFQFATVGCSEKAMAVRIEGIGESSPAKKSGDSLLIWRQGQDAVIAVGLHEAIHGTAPN